MVAAAAAFFGLPAFRVELGLARVEESPFDGRHLVRVGGRELHAGSQPAAAPQLGRFPAAFVPLSGRVDQPALHRPRSGMLL